MTTLDTMAEDIATMRVRGAGKIARHAVRALAEWEKGFEGDLPRFERDFRQAVARLLSTRPTAVSLRNGLRYVEARVAAAPSLPEKRAAVRAAADEFVARSKLGVEAIGELARTLLRDGGTYVTICNSQAALAGFAAARRDGLNLEVVAAETRPWRQGLLTVRQLAEAGVPATLVVDSAVCTFIREADAVFVGCDTIASNGDVVNKVGTCMVSVLARENGIPFYVCGESYKVDFDAPTGASVKIEERDPAEIVDAAEIPPGVRVRNPVFDVTPAANVTRILTELGALAPEDALARAREAWKA